MKNVDVKKRAADVAELPDVASVPKIPKVQRDSPDELKQLVSATSGVVVNNTMPAGADLFTHAQKFFDKLLNFHVYGDRPLSELTKQRQALLRVLVAKVGDVNTCGSCVRAAVCKAQERGLACV